MTTPSLPQGASFLLGDPAAIFTPEQFSSDDRMMVEVAERFCRERVLPNLERLDKQEEGLMPALIREAGELGLCGVDSPDAFGGLGMGKNLAARILEFMSLDGGFSVTYGITSGISQVGLSLFGTEAQKAAYLPALTSGEMLGAYALSEPNSGSDALSATTRADRVEGGFRLNGTKMWISNAKWAGLFLTMAKVDGERFSAFLVERDRLGVSISREEHKMGLKGSSTARLVLEDVFIPDENLLYEEGKGHHVAFNALNLGRFKLASMSIGPARRAIELAAIYAQERKQFGRAIAEFGLVRQMLARAAAIFYVAESMTYRTGALMDGAFEAFGGTVDGNRLAAEMYALEASATKVFASEAEGLIVDDCLQVFGGYGFTEEFPIARIYRDARVSRIYEGTNEINRIYIADRLRKKHPGLVAEAKGSFVAELLSRMPDPGADQVAQGALADLVILTYAEQSARLRGDEELYGMAIPILNAQAAAAYQTATGESVTLPPIAKPPVDAVANRVLAGELPSPA
ncbi:acyl-CoA dehydrogenase [bacterium]|nr:MAG: acyl-CoA dehydrogenase [bacterium]